MMACEVESGAPAPKPAKKRMTKSCSWDFTKLEAKLKVAKTKLPARRTKSRPLASEKGERSRGELAAMDFEM